MTAHTTQKVQTKEPTDSSAAWIVISIVAAVSVLVVIVSYKEDYLGPLLLLVLAFAVIGWLGLLVYAFTGSKRPVMFWKSLLGPIVFYVTLALVFVTGLGRLVNPMIIGNFATGEGGIGPTAVTIIALVAFVIVIIMLVKRLKTHQPIKLTLIVLAAIFGLWWFGTDAPLFVKIAVILLPPIIMIAHLAKLFAFGRRDDHGIARNKWAEKTPLYVAIVALLAGLSCIPLSGAILGLGY